MRGRWNLLIGLGCLFYVILDYHTKSVDWLTLVNSWLSGANILIALSQVEKENF